MGLGSVLYSVPFRVSAFRVQNLSQIANCHFGVPARVPVIMCLEFDKQKPACNAAIMV